MASTGVGALVGTIYLAARNDVGLGKRNPLAAACFGAGLIGFSLSSRIFISFPLIAGRIRDDGEYRVVRYHSPDHCRGGQARALMGLYAMAFAGMAPFGSLLAGTLSYHLACRPRWPSEAEFAWSERDCFAAVAATAGAGSAYLQSERPSPPVSTGLAAASGVTSATREG